MANSEQFLNFKSVYSPNKNLVNFSGEALTPQNVENYIQDLLYYPRNNKKSEHKVNATNSQSQFCSPTWCRQTREPRCDWVTATLPHPPLRWVLTDVRELQGQSTKIHPVCWRPPHASVNTCLCYTVSYTTCNNSDTDVAYTVFNIFFFTPAIATIFSMTCQLYAVMLMPRAHLSIHLSVTWWTVIT